MVANANSAAVLSHLLIMLFVPARPPIHPRSPAACCNVPEAKPKPITESFISRFVVLIVVVVPLTVRSPESIVEPETLSVPPIKSELEPSVVNPEFLTILPVVPSKSATAFAVELPGPVTSPVAMSQ